MARGGNERGTGRVRWARRLRSSLFNSSAIPTPHAGRPAGCPHSATPPLPPLLRDPAPAYPRRQAPHPTDLRRRSRLTLRPVGMHGRAAAAALLAVLALSVSVAAAAADQVADGAAGNGTGAGAARLDRRTKMFLHTARANRAAAGAQEPGLGLIDAFFASLSMIVVSEIGDETFIIAALMAMRHPKSTVLSGALSALVVMTVLSTGLGRIVPNLISRKHTNSAATVLYAFFGLRLLYIAWCSDSKATQKKEIEEVEEKLEAGQGKSTFRRVFSRFCTPIFLESFVLTFLAEWGDRSQIATIALATHKNAVGVATGATLGHTICTSIAVVGGSMLASKISQGTVATIGGLLFLGFSLSSYFYPPL
ncbi:unnamed protein product [Urochloa humidicola]